MYNVTIQLDAKDAQTAQAIVELTGYTVVDVKKQINRRSTAQNRAIHKYFELLAQELNEKGLDQWAVLDQAKRLDWTPEAIKENIWRKVQLVLYPEKESTTQLTTREINNIYDHVNRFIGERGVYVPFPSEEEMRIKSL